VDHETLHCKYDSTTHKRFFFYVYCFSCTLDKQLYVGLCQTFSSLPVLPVAVLAFSPARTVVLRGTELFVYIDRSVWFQARLGSFQCHSNLAKGELVCFSSLLW